jgi:hypothetical protein
VAQLGARFHGMEEVVSSNLTRSTIAPAHNLNGSQAMRSAVPVVILTSGRRYWIFHSMMIGVRLLTVLVLAGWLLPAQYPPRQPSPGQYPPGQYPPGQYPPGQGGGMPGGLPIPQIRWPKRKPKEDKNKPSESKAETQALNSIEGTLRTLGEKDLLLETGEGKVVRFRLIAKTRFVNKDGETMRDSLLKPGDQLSVQVSPDDEETAVRVELVRSGSTEDRAAAAKPVDPAQITTPSVSEPSPATPSQRVSGPDSDSALPADRPGNDGQSIDQARDLADTYLSQLPNFLVTQTTTRYQGADSSWRPVDVVTAELAYAEGKEQYRSVAINGQPTKDPIEKTGAWSTGDWATTLEGIFDLRSQTKFTQRGEQPVASRPAIVFDIAVASERSNWLINTQEGRQHRSGYTGRVWIDRQTHQVLRIEQRSDPFPAGFPMTSVETAIEYGFVRIDAKTFLLPVSSSTIGCARRSCSRNEIVFQNYRRFTADSSIKY